LELEGSGCGLVEVQSRHFPEANDKNLRVFFATGIRTWNFRNTSQECPKTVLIVEALCIGVKASGKLV
jgi:hypothetical protein